MTSVVGLVFATSLVVLVSATVKVSVYYEALCYDSVRFITRQLHPNYQQIAEYVDLDLVPYGKAIHNGNNGTYEFSCQHGPSECKGNMYQSCVLSMNYSTEIVVDFVSCVMGKTNPSELRNVESCVRRSNLDMDKFKTCVSSKEGYNLLALNGDKTWQLEFSLSFVPTIIYDDEFDKTAQDQSLVDFVAVVCSKINGTRPAVCNNRRLPKANAWGYYY